MATGGGRSGDRSDPSEGAGRQVATRATGDRRQGDRRRPSRALPPSREAPLGGWEDGRRPPAPAHAEETGLVDMELGARCC